MSTTIHTLHVILAGMWFGGVVFTTVVVSPALKATKLSEAEQVGVRSVIGKQYARVGTVNLVLVLVFAAPDGLLKGFDALFYLEYVLLLAILALVAAHGAYFGRRLAGLAEAELRAGSAEEARNFVQERHALQKVSLRVSLLDILASAVVVALAVNA